MNGLTTSRRYPIVCLCLLFTGRAFSQVPGAPSKHHATDVVVIALEPLNQRTQDQQRLDQTLSSETQATLDEEKHILDLQLAIVRETSDFGPVLLLAPDDSTLDAFKEDCRTFDLCKLFHRGQVQIKVVPHDGAWIRDYGPQIENYGDSAQVVHWRYFDVRTERAREEKLNALDSARLKLLAERQQADQPEELSEPPMPDQRKAVLSSIDDKLYVLKEYSELLNNASVQRTNDANSAYDIADAVLATPDFSYRSSQLALDGGNLFRLDDGRCLTTRTLLSRNKEENVNVDEELQKVGGCKSVTYLEPLPGLVIEHIDMFLLPAGGKKLMLASYDLTTPLASKYWNGLSDRERELTTNAEIAMKVNADRLRNLGYEVVPVPAPFPQIADNGRTFYPTVLNALVRQASDGYRQLLLPSYTGYESDVQLAALQRFKLIFGEKTEIRTIEAMDAAKAQGAIHCLTLTAPRSLSIFGNSAENAARNETEAQAELLDRNADAEVLSQIPATGLRGSWDVITASEPRNTSTSGSSPQRIHFGASEFEKGSSNHLEALGTYRIERKQAASWFLTFVFPNHEAVAATLHWTGRNEVRLKMEDGSEVMVLKRISSDLNSPLHKERAAHQPAH